MTVFRIKNSNHTENFFKKERKRGTNLTQKNIYSNQIANKLCYTAPKPSKKSHWEWIKNMFTRTHKSSQDQAALKRTKRNYNNS